MKQDQVYLEYILDCIQNIEELSGEGQDKLHEMKHVRAALLYYLQTMAEATQRISPELKVAYPEIDWIAIAGFRNRLTHGYLEVNMKIVSAVIDDYLPDLKTVVQRMLNQLGNG